MARDSLLRRALTAEIRSLIDEVPPPGSASESAPRELVFAEWARMVPEAKSGPLNFDRFPFQREWYEDESVVWERDRVVMKAAQVGVSALAVREGMYWADRRGWTVLYVFPGQNLVTDFCVAEGERVLMADGRWLPIERVREGDRVLTSDGSRVVPDRVVATCRPGRKPVIRVGFAGGRRIRVTREHRVWTKRGWVEAGDLRPGDRVAVPKALPDPESPEHVDPDDATMLAAWLAEGSKTGRGFRLTLDDGPMLERVEMIAARRGWKVTRGDRCAVYVGADGRRDGDTPMALLRRFGVVGASTFTVGVPDAIMRAQRGALEAFLSAYVACDGHVGRNEITVASGSERMARDLQALALRLGIVATVRHNLPSRAGGARVWTFAVGTEAGRDAMARIGVPGKLAVAESYGRRGRRDQYHGEETRDRARAMRRAGVTLTAIGREVGVSAVNVRKWCAEPSDVGWATVRWSHPDGVEETFDLTTETHASFFLEGVLTHNSDQRIRPLIDASPYLQERIPRGHTANKGLKQIGKGFLVLRGSRSSSARQSVDADAVIFDEYDYLEPEAIPDLEKRVGGSEQQMFRRIGYPTIPDWGMHAAYQETDMRRWTVRCECGEWQTPEFGANVDQQQMLVVCRKCRRPLPVAEGEWVAEFPDRDLRGYHVSKLIVPAVAENRLGQLGRLVRDSRKTRPIDQQNFLNKDLGLPYDSPDGRLSMDAIQAAQSAGGYAMQAPDVGYGGANLVTAGVDVASVRDLNVRVSEHLPDGRRRALFIGTAASFDEVDAILTRYRVQMAVVDHLPEYRLAMGLAERHAGRVFLCSYTGAQQAVVMSVTPETRAVSVRRTEAIDAMMDAIRQQRNLLPDPLPEDYVTQLRNLYRRKREDEVGRVVVEYVSTGPTDYAHAEVYDVIAAEVWWWRQGVSEAEREVFEPLENRLEFSRSPLTTGDEGYAPFEGAGAEPGGYSGLTDGYGDGPSGFFGEDGEWYHG